MASLRIFPTLWASLNNEYNWYKKSVLILHWDAFFMLYNREAPSGVLLVFRALLQFFHGEQMLLRG